MVEWHWYWVSFLHLKKRTSWKTSSTEQRSSWRWRVYTVRNKLLAYILHISVPKWRYISCRCRCCCFCCGRCRSRCCCCCDGCINENTMNALLRQFTVCSTYLHFVTLSSGPVDTSQACGHCQPLLASQYSCLCSRPRDGVRCSLSLGVVHSCSGVNNAAIWMNLDLTIWTNGKAVSNAISAICRNKF